MSAMINAKGFRKIADSYNQEIKKSAWMSAAIAAMGPAASASVLVVIGGTAALTPVTGPAILAVTAASTIVTGILKYIQDRKNLVSARDERLEGWMKTNPEVVKRPDNEPMKQEKIMNEQIERIIPMDEREEILAYREGWRNQLEDVIGNEILMFGEAGLIKTPAIEATPNEAVQKGLVFKMATDAGKLAWNSSHAMSVGTTEERETYRLSQDVMASTSNSPEARLARMVQTVIEADMRGLSTKAVVAEMREEGQRLGLVDTDVDVVLGLAGDAYASMAATRNAEMFDDGIHNRLVNRTLLVTAALQGHDSVAEAEKSFLSHHTNYAVAYSNNQEAVSRLASGAEVPHHDGPKQGAQPVPVQPVPTQPVPTQPVAAENAPIQNAAVSLRDGIKPRETGFTASSYGDLKIQMACDALSKIDAPKGAEGERTVGELLLRVKDSVNDRLYGRGAVDGPPSADRLTEIEKQVASALTQGSDATEGRYKTEFASTFKSIAKEISNVFSKIGLGANKDQSADVG